jgi:hypothetical protein
MRRGLFNLPRSTINDIRHMTKVADNCIVIKTHVCCMDIKLFNVALLYA